jgi:transcriptional regulator GlxA family with amidase domain
VRFQQLKHGEAYHSPIAWRLLDQDAKQISLDHPLFEAYRAESVEQTAGALTKRTRVLIIPPLNTCSVPDLRRLVDSASESTRLISRHHAAGGIICMIGSGAWLAASTGILDGRSVAIPWNIHAWFAAEFPRVEAVVTDVPHRDGPCLSVSAASLQHQMLSSLLEQEGLADLARIITQVLVVDLDRQAAVSDAHKIGLITRTGDSVLLKASQWIRENLSEEITIDAIAEAANVSRRTLFRHFDREMKCRPLDYVTALRVKRAQVLLEITLKSTDEIALACGYGSSRSLRRAFLRLTGRSLTSYREIHSQRAKRSRWRIKEVVADGDAGNDIA